MISVIVPTLNESRHLAGTLDALYPYRAELDVVVADGGSEDGTRDMLGATPWIRWGESAPGRARQMNEGARRARGDILLFLHADTQLEEGWLSAVKQAAASPGFSIGAFRFAIRSGRPAYRLIEGAVRSRCHLFRLPYGDQALFLRKNAFWERGGFPEIPLMEDVELVRTHRALGRLVLLKHRAWTSPRKWERDGIWRRTLRNGHTYLSYRRGRPMEQLHEAYDRGRTAICIFCKQPEPGRVKTRLAATVGNEEAVRLYRKMVTATVTACRTCKKEPEVLIFFDPPGAKPFFCSWLGTGQHYIAQSGADLGQRMLAAFRYTHARGYSKTIIVGTDCPALSAQHLQQAMKLLPRHDVVLGPTCDGGYYLVAAVQPYPELFQRIPWSTDRVFDDTCRAARSAGLRVATLATLRDVDDVHDLEHHRTAGTLP